MYLGESVTEADLVDEFPAPDLADDQDETFLLDDAEDDCDLDVEDDDDTFEVVVPEGVPDKPLKGADRECFDLLIQLQA